MALNQEVIGSTPWHSPSQSLARKLISDWPEAQYCLKIQVTSTEDGRMTPPTHAWQEPVVENMVWDGKSSLTEAVMTGPDWAILFFQWQSLGEELRMGKAQDAVFMLLGAISWVGKQAQLSVNLVSLGEGQQLIAQAITKGHIKPRGLGCPRLHSTCCVNIVQHCSTFIIKTCLHNQQASQQLFNNGRCPCLALGQCIKNEAGCHSKAKIKARGNKSYGQTHPNTIHPHQIMDLKVTEVQHQPPHWCLQGQRDQEVPGIHTMANGPTGNLEAIWRSTCQSSRTRTQKMPSYTKVGIGT